MRLLLDAGYSHLLTRRCGCGKWMLTSMLMTCCALQVLQASAQTHQRAAQIWKNLRSTCLKLSGDTLVIDTLSIVPGSLRVYGVADSDYVAYPLQGYLLWKHWPAVDSLAGQAEQSYDYTFQSWAPTVQYVPNTQWRVEWRYNWEHKQNAIDAGGESYSEQAITGMLNWSRLATMRLEISCTCKYIRFRGATSSAAGFSMLEGLMPGRNWLWHIGCTRRLAGNIELDFIYEGRKTGTARVIHTGTATIRAVF